MTTVTTKCPVCNKKRVINPGEIAPDDYPMCNDCGMPMIPVSAQS